MKRVWILFYYNSLPDMPKGCRLFSSEIMHRDFFKCNPTNTNHYQYPKFEGFFYDEGCHRREVNKFLDKSGFEKYVVFYTRHTPLKGQPKNKVVGYFKVGREFNVPKRGFRASEAVLLPKQECIPIDYDKRGVPVSWGHTSIRTKIDRILENFINKRKSSINIAEKYKEETKKVMLHLNNMRRRNRLVADCEKCSLGYRYWTGKKNKQEILNELYGRKGKC